MNSDPEPSTSNEGRCLKFYWMNSLDNFKGFLFGFHTFGVRRRCKALEARIRSDFNRIRNRACFLDLGHKWNVGQQKDTNKKEGFEII